MKKFIEKLFMPFLNMVEPFVLPLIKQASKESIKKAFEFFFAVQKDHAKVALVALYPIIDIQVEDLVRTSDTKYDDAVVDGLKEGMEEVAKKEEIELPNLDDD